MMLNTTENNLWTGQIIHFVFKSSSFFFVILNIFGAIFCGADVRFADFDSKSIVKIPTKITM